MTKTWPNEDSPIYNSYPSAMLYWDIIHKAEESLDNLPQDLFLLPSRLKNAQSSLKKLDSLKTEGFYRKLTHDDELARIHKTLADVIKRLNNKMQELQIKEVDDAELGKYYNFEECPMVDERLRLDEHKYIDKYIESQ